MNIPIRLLLIEDSEDDALLLQRKLRKSGYDLVSYRRVDTEAALRGSLENETWDVIITDYSMPSFDGLTALEIFKSYNLDLPFIIVSGTIGEAVAVAAMKAGAHDYVMKDNLARLGPAVERELKDAEARRARREAEEQVRILSRAVEQSPSVVVITDTNGAIEYVNAKFTEITGYTAEEALGENPRILKSDDMPSDVYTDMWTALKEGREWKSELRNLRKDGSSYWASMAMSSIRNQADQITHYMALQEDITDRKLAEDALRESESRFRQLVEQAADAIFVFNHAGEIQDVNQQSCESLGYTREELLQMTIYDLDKEIGPEETEVLWQHLTNTTMTRKSRHHRKDGSTYPVEINASQVIIHGETLLLASARDITERERFEKTLQMYSEQLEDLVQERTQQLEQHIGQLQAILESSSDAIALAESNGDLRTTNPAFKAMFGAKVNKAIEQLLTVVADVEHIEPITNALFTVLRQGQSARAEARIMCLDGSEIDTDIAMTPVHNQTGQAIGIVISLRDISHLKEIDRFKTQFVANAAHDLANPIANIKLHLYALESNPEKTFRYMKVLHSQTRRMENLVNDLRMLSQLDRGATQFEMAPLDLHMLLEDAVHVHQPRALAQHQRLIYQPTATAAVILADHAKFERVVVNLLSNALNYTPEGGSITIRTSSQDGTVLISVADTGIGIDPHELPNIFERFYRSDSAKLTGVEGTGLGLAIVKDIVEAHNGQISVESTPNVGTCFNLTLPLYHD